jgi:hypothetical protein
LLEIQATKVRAIFQHYTERQGFIIGVIGIALIFGEDSMLVLIVVAIIVTTLIFLSAVAVLCAVVAAGRADRQLEAMYLETRGSYETGLFGGKADIR